MLEEPCKQLETKHFDQKTHYNFDPSLVLIPAAHSRVWVISFKK